MASKDKGVPLTAGNWVVTLLILFSFVVLPVSAYAEDFFAGLMAYLRGDFEAALQILQPLAEEGDASAQSYLGLMYATGQGVPEDDIEAVKWYRKAAEQGHEIAQSDLAMMYAMGEGVPENDAEAVKWFRMAADQGLAHAQYNLGIMYDVGEGVPEDDAEAAKWFRMAAQQGHASAQYNLGAMHAKGEGVSKDYVQAYAWFNVAAAQGYELAKNIKEVIVEVMNREDLASGQELAREYWDAYVVPFRK